MAFGKKKEKKNAKKKRDASVKEQLVQMSHNPLYPEKKESTAKEVLTALGTAVLCLVLVGVITVNFSYAFGNGMPGESYEVGDDSTTYEQPEGEITEEVEDEVPVEETGEVEEIQEQEVVEENLVEGDYIISESNSRYISESELHNLSKEELSYARNEIYARHGRRFKDEGLQQYFDSKDWYEGTIAPEDFSEGMLNDYEIKNANTILSYEKAKGYR